MSRTLRLVLMFSFVLAVTLLATTVPAPQAPADIVASLDSQYLVSTASDCGSGYPSTPGNCPTGPGECRYVVVSGCCYCW